jgi:hypothetical protein
VRTVALVVGHATLDLLGDALAPGGSAYYAAHTLAALGAEVRVLTCAGTDLPSTAFAGLDVRVLPAPRTTRFENLHDPSGRRTQRAHAVAPPLEPSALPGAWLAPDLLLLAPVAGELAPEAFVGVVRARVAGLCVQGLVREVRAAGEVAPRPLRSAPGALAGIDAAFLGDDEAAGQPELADELAAAVPIVAWTHGARGSEVLASGRVLRAGVHPAREVDPTGAGDAYAAAFLFALARGGTPRDAARLGAAAASIVVEGPGGSALPRVGEAFLRAAAVPVD